MRLNQEFVAQKIGAKTILVPTGASVKKFHGIVKLNETAAFIVSCLKSDTTEEELCRRMDEAYNATPEQIRQSVSDTLKSLREAHALVE